MTRKKQQGKGAILAELANMTLLKAGQAHQTSPRRLWE